MVDYIDNETKYLLDTRNHKIFTKFTPELKGLAECTYIERFTNTSKEAQRAYKKKYNELKKNDPEFKRKMQNDKEDLEISSLEDMVTYFSKQRNFFIRELGFISYDTFFINAVIVRAYQLNNTPRK